MYTYKVFTGVKQLEDFLNGAIVSEPLQALIYGLNNKTLVINDGSEDRTTTFVDASGAGLSSAAILTQILATHANLRLGVGLRNYEYDAKLSQIAIFKIGFAIKAGTANELLCLPAGTVTVTELATATVLHVMASHAQGTRLSVLIHQ